MTNTSKIILSTYIILFLSIAFFASNVQANGADERYIDGLLVGFTIAPLSPFVEEKTEMLISFRDADSGEYITNIPEAKVVIEAFSVNGYEPQEIIFETKFIDSSLGSFNVPYEFQKEGLYDIHVLFTTQDGKEQNVGYFRQIRTGILPEQNNSSKTPSLLFLIGIGLLSFATGYFISQFSKK